MTQTGTPLWCAPEILMGKPYCEDVDVFSFGVVLYEVVAKRWPYEELRKKTPSQELMKSIGIGLVKPELTDEECERAGAGRELRSASSFLFQISRVASHNSTPSPTSRQSSSRAVRLSSLCSVHPRKSSSRSWTRYGMTPSMSVALSVRPMLPVPPTESRVRQPRSRKSHRALLQTRGRKDRGRPWHSIDFTNGLSGTMGRCFCTSCGAACRMRSEVMRFLPRKASTTV